MTKEIMYKYLGTNGTICSPVHLEDIYYIRLVRLTAENGKVLYKNGKNMHVISTLVPEDEVNEWTENEDNNN